MESHSRDVASTEHTAIVIKLSVGRSRLEGTLRYLGSCHLQDIAGGSSHKFQGTAFVYFPKASYIVQLQPNTALRCSVKTQNPTLPHSFDPKCAIKSTHDLKEDNYSYIILIRRCRMSMARGKDFPCTAARRWRLRLPCLLGGSRPARLHRRVNLDASSRRSYPNTQIKASPNLPSLRRAA